MFPISERFSQALKSPKSPICIVTVPMLERFLGAYNSQNTSLLSYFFVPNDIKTIKQACKEGKNNDNIISPSLQIEIIRFFSEEAYRGGFLKSACKDLISYGSIMTNSARQQLKIEVAEQLKQYQAHREKKVPLEAIIWAVNPNNILDTHLLQSSECERCNHLVSNLLAKKSYDQFLDCVWAIWTVKTHPAGFQSAFDTIPDQTFRLITTHTQELVQLIEILIVHQYELDWREWNALWGMSNPKISNLVRKIQNINIGSHNGDQFKVKIRAVLLSGESWQQEDEIPQLSWGGAFRSSF